MKKYLLISILFSTLLFSSCESYLQVPSEATITEEKLFGNYNSFQGYVDQIYNYLVDPINMLTSSHCHGGEAISATGWITGYKGVRGEYNNFLGRGYFADNADFNPGIWFNGWKAIRAANVGLKNLHYLANATQEEQELIKGQLLFFRAFFHFELLSAWGSIPYINEVLVEDLKKPRFYEYKGKHNYQACTEYIAEDLEEAANLLPDAWVNDVRDRGRVTKMAALGYLTKSLLYAGSPLMNEYSKGAAEVNKEFMERAAKAAWQAIQLDERSSAYGLLEWKDYQKSFATTDNTMPWTIETVWGRYNINRGNNVISNLIGRIHAPTGFGGNSLAETVTQNYVDLFEMNDGTLYKQEYDNDNAKRWDARDPRFRQNIYVDRDVAGLNVTRTTLKLFQGGSHKTHQTCYYIYKFWPKGANTIDNGAELTNYRMMNPLMRLADIYLMYAEAANEAYGSGNGRVPGATLSALEAVNKVRERAGQVQTTATGGAHESFRKMILNERAVEMCFEGQYWYDIRRWKIGPSLHNMPIYDMVFDKEWTNFTRNQVFTRVFEAPKHYWLPFPRALTQMYAEFPQNEGWN